MIDRDAVLRKLVDIQYSRNDQALGARLVPGARATRSRSSPPTPRPPTARCCSATRSRRAGVRPAHRRGAQGARARGDLAGHPLRHRPGHDRARGGRDPRRAGGAAPGARGAGQAAGVPPAAPAHPVRHGDAARARLLQRDRELLAHPRRPRARRAALLPAGLLPRGLRLLHRRVAPDRARRSAACTRATARASRRWWTTASGCPARWTTGPRPSTSSSPACRRWCSSRPPPASSSATTPRGWSSRSCGRPGIVDPEVDVRETKNQIDDLMNEIKRRAEAGERDAGHHADQEDGRGPDRLPARVRLPGALPALRGGHARADPDHPRAAAGRVRRAGRA